jgi:phosphoglycerol transferase
MNFGKIKLFFHAPKREIALYLFCEVICILALIWILRLWDADFSVPFSYSGDGLAMSTFCKVLIDNIWWTQNSFMGMPFGQDNFDFPLSNTFALLIIKIIGVLSQNFAVTINLFYVLTFPFTAFTALYVFRKLRISPGPSVVGSLLFTFIPFHFLRGEDHLFYSSYFLIPLIVLVMIWIYEGKPVIFNFEKNKIDIGNCYSIMSLIICGLMAIQQLYYLFFSCFLFLVVGVILSIKNKNKNYLISTLLLIGLMVTILLVTVSPVLMYQHDNGPNPEAILRSPSESETYGLKIAQLILPIPGHRIPLFATIHSRYSSTAPLVNENSFSALGLIGAVGFILLIVWFFMRVEGISFPLLSEVQTKLNCLSILNMSALLLATVGGFGTIVAYGFFYDIRAYNRISIFIAFFAISTIILLLEVIQTKCCTTKKRKIFFFGLLCLLLIGGILDQTSPTFIPAYNSTKQQYFIHQQFVNNIEDKMPANSMIFQLPYVQYMGWGKTSGRLPLYSEAIPYLHSKKLRWSFGAMVNRKADLWQRTVSELPLVEQVNRLSYAGFNGILVDMEGYKKSDQNIPQELHDILHIEPLVSADKRYYFFDMSEYNLKLKSGIGEEKWDYMVNETLNPLIFEWTQGFSNLEGSPDLNWRWCGPTGELHITNPASQYKTISFETTFVTGYPENSSLIIHTTNFTDTIEIKSSGTVYHKTISLSPGESTISFSCNAKRIIAQDKRTLIFNMKNFTIGNESFIIS